MVGQSTSEKLPLGFFFPGLPIDSNTNPSFHAPLKVIPVGYSLVMHWCLTLAIHFHRYTLTHLWTSKSQCFCCSRPPPGRSYGLWNRFQSGFFLPFCFPLSVKFRVITCAGFIKLRSALSFTAEEYTSMSLSKRFWLLHFVDADATNSFYSTSRHLSRESSFHRLALLTYLEKGNSYEMINECR